MDQYITGDVRKLRTPCYIIQEAEIEKNLQILGKLSQETGCKILLAQKAFSNFALYPLIGEYLAGTTASGLYEAILGREEMNKENHIFSPAYREEEMPQIIQLCDHIVFNSRSQLLKYGAQVLEKGKGIGLRINPECSTQEGHEIYDPCAPGSRLGITLEKFQEILPEELAMVEGLHFHTLCEQNADALEKTLQAVEEKFGKYLYQMKWLNFGGGHHITRSDYDLELLKKCIFHMQDTYHLQVYLEPGEAVALRAGTLRTQVLEIVDNGIQIAILDTSAACHMPDVLEMPYRPPLQNSGEGCASEEYPYVYRLAGPTCLAGDVIGDYSFAKPLQTGDVLTFEDMAIYTTVKNNTFNGMRLPDIVLEKKTGEYTMLRSFGYEDFKMRL